MIGVRAYTGIDNKIKPNPDTFKVYRLGFDKDGKKVSSGDTYRVRLEKNSSSYVVYQLDMDGTELYKYEIPIQAKDIHANSISGYEDLNDPMNVQDRFAYVGFAVARGMNVTYSNIKFEKSGFDANDWRPQESRYIDLQAKITSPDTAAEENYTLVFKANANGLAKIYQDNVLKDSVEIVDNKELKKDYDLSLGKNFSVEFTPEADYEPEPFVKLKSYETVTLNKSVSLRTIGKDSYIYVSNTGSDENDGSGYDNAISLESAIKYAKPGQTILLKPEVYDMSNKALTVQKGRNGREDNPIRIQGDGGFATLDFKRSGKGFSLGGDYWELKQFSITNTADGYKGLGISGSHNIVERLNLFNNGTTGLQISGSSEDSKDKWPSYNYILNCTSMNNADSAMEDADGFAAKITSGVGNVFDGCMAAYNADDGWDLFAKVATGSIGDVTIKNSVAYRNGYLLVKNGGNKKNFEFAPVTVDGYGNLSFEKPNIKLDAGNGNGFKMGGSNVFGAHKLDNSISYENKAKGIDSNSGPNIKISNSTSYNNGSYNVALYTSDKTLKTDFSAKGILSFRKGTNIGEQLSLQSQQSFDVMDVTNFYWNKDENISKNTATKVITVDENDFINLDTENDPKRNEDGKINMNGLLLLKPEAKERLSSGAGGRAFGEAEIIPDTPSKNSNVTEEKSKDELSNDTYEKPKDELPNDTYENPKDELPNDGRQDNNSGKNPHLEVSAKTEAVDNKNKSESDDSRVVIPKNSNSKVKKHRSSSSSSSSKGSKKVFHNTFTGWKPETVNGHNVWKYVETGKNVVSQWAYIFNPYTNRNAWFKFDKDGVMETGWVHENGTDYYLSEISDGSLGEWIKK